MFARLIMPLLVGVSLVLAGCAGRATPTPTPAPRPTAVIETRLTAAERAAIFDAVWQTVNDQYFDPTFGGKDWQAIGDEYRQKLATVQDDDTFWRRLLNPMLFELGVSHLVALPPELASELDHMTFATGSLGMDVRLLDGKAVVTQVVEGSPAGEAGLRPGLVITSVDGWTLSDLAAESLQTPPDNERNRRGNAIQGMRSLLYGETGTEVVIEYQDANDRTQRTSLEFAPRSGSACAQLDPVLPPACAEIEVRRLDNGIGYLRFSGFLEAALDGVLQAIDDLHDAPALIIDLRGNPGGQFPVRKAIASQLVGEPKLFMRYQHRDGLEEAYLDPVPDPYEGKVVILVDELSASSSEEFAGSLQALGRATIVGSQTPGRCLVMNIAPLPNDALLVYPYGQSQTPDGRVLEDNGVVPDIEVALDRSLLLQGIDSQLEAAIDYIEEQGAMPPATLRGTQAQQARTEEITFQSGSFTLVGDLWLPEGTGPFPVILLNQGSGMDARTNRGYSPVLERMLQAGYAVFSWDKPGVGKSIGQLSDARVLHERAQILLDAIEVMKAHPDLDPQRIGLEGASQAGYVMSLVLSTSQDIAFMICSSCPGMSGVDQTTYQYMAIALCTGTPEGQSDRRAELLAELDAARTYETYGQYAHYREVIQALFSTASNVPQGYGFEVVPEEAWRLNDPENETWWDPMGVIRHTTIPVLVLLGDQDRQMDPLQAAHAWREALEVAGNPNSRVELFANANHNLLVSETGCPDDDLRWLEEYVKARGYESLTAAMAAIQENPELMNQFPFAPGYLDTIEVWLRDLGR